MIKTERGYPSRDGLRDDVGGIVGPADTDFEDCGGYVEG